MKDRSCACCGIAFVAKAEGQIACTFACARQMVARRKSPGRVQREPTPDVAPGTEPRIAEALAETRANGAAMKGPPS